MTDQAGTLENTSPAVQFSVETSLIDAEGDACVDWLQKRYRHVRPDTRVSTLKEQIANDVAVCSAARWKRFAFPSDPYVPLRPNFNNEETKSAAVKVVVTSAEKEPGYKAQGSIVRARIVDAKAGPSAAAPETPVDPSRHVWESLLYAESAPPAGVVRPAYGGYVLPTHTDALRFVAFPQRHHSPPPSLTPDSTGAPRSGQSAALQQVPSYVRGTARLDRDMITPLSGDPDNGHAEEARRHSSYLARLLAASQVNLFAAQRLPRHERRTGVFSGTLWRHVDAVDWEVYSGNKEVERRYVPDTSKVQRCTFMRHGVAMTLSRPNPRYGLRWEASVSTVQGSGRQRQKLAAPDTTRHEHDDPVLAIAVTDTYHSGPQKWNLSSFLRRHKMDFWRAKLSTPARAASTSSTSSRPVGGKGADTVLTYGARWQAGPGLEVTPADACATVYGKLASEAWVDIPLVSRFSLKLRQQSAIVQPFSPADVRGAHVPEAEDTEQGEAPAHWLRPHRFFWATQGPKWDPKLVRGFDNDYSALHHAQRWYALVSAEVSRRKQKNKNTRGHAHSQEGLVYSSPDAADSEGDGDSVAANSGFFSRVGLAAFANACFADSLRSAPRASLGFSLQSDLPRFTVDAYNKIAPSTFECSFSWFVAVKEGKLMTGLRPGVPEDQQFMRVSPVETFRHMRCGLTWKF